MRYISQSLTRETVSEWETYIWKDVLYGLAFWDWKAGGGVCSANVLKRKIVSRMKLMGLTVVSVLKESLNPLLKTAPD